MTWMIIAIMALCALVFFIRRDPKVNPHVKPVEEEVLRRGKNTFHAIKGASLKEPVCVRDQQ